MNNKKDKFKVLDDGMRVKSPEKETQAGMPSMADMVKAVAADLAQHIIYAQLQVKIMRAKYLALVKEGFTQEQAERLCK